MEQEIQEIIKKNLPSHVGEALKARLEQADKDTKDLERTKELLSNSLHTVADLKTQLGNYQKMDERNLSLDNREDAIKRREINSEIASLEVKLECEKEKSEFAKNIGLGLVRNTEYREITFNSKDQMGYSNGNNGYIQPTPIITNNTSTKIAD